VQIQLAVVCLLFVQAGISWAQWTEIYRTGTPWLAQQRLEWHLFNSPDTDRFYLYAPMVAASPGIKCFLVYAIQPGPVTTNPWVKVSSCGDGKTHPRTLKQNAKVPPRGKT